MNAVQGMAAADFDRDGRIDLAVYSNTRRAIVYGKPDGTFANRGHINEEGTLQNGSRALGLAVAYLDADAFPDLVVPVRTRVDVLVWRPTGPVAAPSVDVSSFGNSLSQGVATGDFDGDTLTDLVVHLVGTATGTTDQALFIKGRGDGTFGAPAALGSLGIVRTTPAYALRGVDIDGDGLLDLAGASQSVGGRPALVVRLGRGNGTFADPVVTNLVAFNGWAVGFAFSDVDVDGHLDAVVTTNVHGAWALRGRGDGTWYAPRPLAGGGPATGFTSSLVALQDLDDDGMPELVVGHAPGVGGTEGFAVLPNVSQPLAVLPTFAGAGPVTLTLRGIPFEDGASVRLRRVGHADIVAGSVRRSGADLIAIVDLSLAAIGDWDVTITTATGDVTATAAVTVEPPRAGRFWVDILGRRSLRAGRDSPFLLMAGNTGNTDLGRAAIQLSTTANWIFAAAPVLLAPGFTLVAPETYPTRPAPPSPPVVPRAAAAARAADGTPVSAPALGLGNFGASVIADALPAGAVQTVLRVASQSLTDGLFSAVATGMSDFSARVPPTVPIDLSVTEASTSVAGLAALFKMSVPGAPDLLGRLSLTPAETTAAPVMSRSEADGRSAFAITATAAAGDPDLQQALGGALNVTLQLDLDGPTGAFDQALGAMLDEFRGRRCERVGTQALLDCVALELRGGDALEDTARRTFERFQETSATLDRLSRALRDAQAPVAPVRGAQVSAPAGLGLFGTIDKGVGAVLAQLDGDVLAGLAEKVQSLVNVSTPTDPRAPAFEQLLSGVRPLVESRRRDPDLPVFDGSWPRLQEVMNALEDCNRDLCRASQPSSSPLRTPGAVAAPLPPFPGCDRPGHYVVVELPGRSVVARDPNEKVGPEGVGPRRAISGDEPLRYAIFFENQPQATAPAAVVTITDPIDPLTMDLRTLELGPISIGPDAIAVPPPGLQSWQTIVDLRPAQDLAIGIDAALDLEARVLRWTLTTLDPVTQRPHEDPLAGFLPPNVTAPEGEGLVSFTVMPRRALPSGTELGNAASIVFDANEAIATNRWTNVIDAAAPEATVEPLPATQASTEFVVTWSGTDLESGVRDFTVLVSEDDGPLAVWMPSTSATSGVFSGDRGRRYGFVAVARDLLGHEQAVPAVVQSTTFVEAAGSAADADGDGLDDAWESRFGLDPTTARGVHGGSADPDGDGRTNAQEQTEGTHPRGTSHGYLAEGATGAFFGTRVALANPTEAPAHALLTFSAADGRRRSTAIDVPPMRRVSVDPSTVAGLEVAEIATHVESDRPLVLARTMSWDQRGYGSHAERGIASPATRWYLAEGATHSGFDLFYLLQNATDVEAVVEVTYLRPSPLPAVVREYVVGPGRRFNIWVNREGPELAATDVSAVVTSTNGVPIIVERAMYASSGLAFGAGHESAGVPQPASRWLLAEGATGPYFDLFVLVANPTSRSAPIEATFLLPDGRTITKAFEVAAQSRFNIWVDHVDPELADTAVSTTIASTAGVPVVVERAMWWPGTVDSWHEAHNSSGATETATAWAVAEGEVGGPRATESYVLVANPSMRSGGVRVTLLFEDGPPAERTFTIGPRSRFNVSVRDEFPESVNRRFGVLVESVAPSPLEIVVEWAMYSDAEGLRWAAGSNALATKLR